VPSSEGFTPTLETPGPRTEIEKGHIKDLTAVIRHEEPIIDGIKVDYFNINADLVEIHEPYELGEGNLHYLERQLYTKALDTLRTRESAEDYLRGVSDPDVHPGNAVVVDMLVRGLGGVIAEDPTNPGHPATHSFTLWKKSDTEIVLIDPSNTNFSQPVVTALNNLRISRSEITSEDIAKQKLYNPGPRLTGYSDHTKRYPKPRDCTDMAIKVVLELNTRQQTMVHAREEERAIADKTPNKVMEETLTQLTNQSAVNRTLTSVKLSGTSWRELTSSSASVRAASAAILRDMAEAIKNHKLSREYIDGVLAELKQEYIQAKEAIETKYTAKIAEAEEAERATVAREAEARLAEINRKYGDGAEKRLKAILQSNPPFSAILLGITIDYPAAPLEIG
jgi:hypothetical protein